MSQDNRETVGIREEPVHVSTPSELYDVVWKSRPCNSESFEETCHENRVGKNRGQANAKSIKSERTAQARYAQYEHHVRIVCKSRLQDLHQDQGLVDKKYLDRNEVG